MRMVLMARLGIALGVAIVVMTAVNKSVAGPAHDAPFTLLRHDVLTVCTSTAFAPVAYQRDGQLTGHDITFLSDFAASLKLDITFKTFAFDGLWLRPGRDECDIAASGISKRQQRLSQGVGWSVPYHEVLRTLLIRAADAPVLKQMDDFGGRTIAFVEGSTADVDTRARAPADARLLPYQSAQQGVLDVLAGRIDAFAEGTISSDHFRAQYEGLAATPGHKMIGGEREFLRFPYRQASGVGAALDEYIRENEGRYGVGR